MQWVEIRAVCAYIASILLSVRALQRRGVCHGSFRRAGAFRVKERVSLSSVYCALSPRRFYFRPVSTL